MTNRRILGGLLAAGRSRRFGTQDKLRAILAGEPVAAHSARALQGSGCAKFVAVTGPATAEFLTSEYGLLEAVSEDAGLGDNLALLAQYAAQQDYSHLLVHLADMPLVPPSHLRCLIERADDDRPVASEVAGRIQVPCLFPRSWFPRLRELSGDRGATGLLSPDTSHAIALARELALDIDARDDLELAEAQLRGASGS